MQKLVLHVPVNVGPLASIVVGGGIDIRPWHLCPTSKKAFMHHQTMASAVSPHGIALQGWHFVEDKNVFIAMLIAKQKERPETCFSCNHHSYKTFSALICGTLSAQTCLPCLA